MFLFVCVRGLACVGIRVSWAVAFVFCAYSFVLLLVFVLVFVLLFALMFLFVGMFVFCLCSSSYLCMSWCALCVSVRVLTCVALRFCSCLYSCFSLCLRSRYYLYLCLGCRVCLCSCVCSCV